MRLSIVVPAHNEEHRIGRMLDAYLPYFSGRYGGEVEFIVMVNGSVDRTDEVVRGYAAKFPCVKLMVDPDPIGKGGALIKGFAAAQGGLVGFVDADGSTPPEAFQDLVDKTDDAPVIVASRWCRGAQVDPPQPLFRRIASRSFNLFTNMLFGFRLTDTQCGAKVFRRDALMKVLPHLGVTKWAFDVDLLFQFKRSGCVAVEVPTVWHDTEGSKIADVVKTSFEMFVALVRLRVVYSPFRWMVRFYDKTLGPLVQPHGAEPDYLLRHSLVLLTGSQVTNVLNLAFQLVMVRMLTGEDCVQYGIMASMMALFFMISAPAGALGRMVAHYVAMLVKDGRRDLAKGLVKTVGLDCSWVVVPLCVAGVLCSNLMAGFFRLTSPWPVIATVLALGFGWYKAVLDSAINGVQAFFWSSATAVIWSLVRLVAGVVLVLVGMGALGAVWGNTVATFLSLAVAAGAMRLLLVREHVSRHRERGMYPYFAGYMLALAGYGVLANADTVLVKRLFDAADAGSYAVAAMVARTVFYLPLPIALVMFPKVVSGGTTDASSRRVLLKSLVLVAVITIGIGGLVLLFPAPALLVLAGRQSAELVFLLRGLVVALAPLSFVVIAMNFELAQRRFIVTVPLLLSALVYVVAVVLWHGTLGQVVAAAGAGIWMAAITCGALLPWHKRGETGAGRARE